MNNLENGYISIPLRFLLGVGVRHTCERLFNSKCPGEPTDRYLFPLAHTEKYVCDRGLAVGRDPDGSNIE